MLYNNNSSFSINPFTIHRLSIYIYMDIWFYRCHELSIWENIHAHVLWSLCLTKKDKDQCWSSERASGPTVFLTWCQKFLSAALTAPIRNTSLVPQSVGLIVRMERVQRRGAKYSLGLPFLCEVSEPYRGRI